MIILRQKEYATGAERAMIALNKVPKPTLKELAKEKSRQKRRSTIRKINSTLGKRGIEGKGLSGFFRGKSVRARVKMGYNSPEAVERLRKKKISDTFKDESTSPESMEKKIRETLGDKVKRWGKKTVDRTKSGVKKIYTDTPNVVGKAVGYTVGHPGFALTQGAATIGPYAILPAAQATAVQGVMTATHPTTATWLAGKWIADDIPVKKAVRDINGEKKRDSSGKVIKKKYPLGKLVNHAGIKLHKKIIDMYEGKPLKGALKRAGDKIRESHHASHPYENVVAQ